MVRWSALFPGSSRNLAASRPSLTLFFWLIGAFLLTIIPHVGQLPIWLSVLVVLAILIRSTIEIYRLPLPSSAFCSILALCLLAGILLQFYTIFGRDAGTAFTVGLLSIKFFELRGPRDVALIIFSSFFVVMSALLYSQAIELFVYCLIMMWVLTGILLRTQMGDTPDQRLIGMLRQSAIIFVQAMPLMIFLFFFFPRFTGKLQIGLDGTSIGLTDKIEPGSISRLADDDSPVMRVTFLNGDVPDITAMYWRGLVLWNYQNGAWTQEAPNPKTGEVTPQSGHLPLAAEHSNTSLQEITIWPHFQRWLFALDYPISKAIPTSTDPNWSQSYSGGVLQLGAMGAKLDHKEQYTVTSASEVAEAHLTPEEWFKGVQVPLEEISPRVQALADQLYASDPGPRNYVLSVLHYFRSQHFLYTDSPGTMEKDPLDEFLFVKKRGFCEHFASTFAILMRLKHVPARLVVGYQGGQHNPYRDFYLVKQSNAHAWDEVWIDSEHRWIRVDPTAVISNGEVQPFTAGTSTAGRPEPDESLSIQVAHHRFTFLSSAYMPEWMRHTLLDMQLRRQQVEADWDDWVFSYDPSTQGRLTDALGLGSDSHSTLLLLCLAAVVICWVVFRQLMKQKRVLAPVEDLYAQFCRNMAQRGMPRAVWEGPLSYTNRVAEAFPEKREVIHDVGRIVTCSRYGRLPLEPSDPKKLKSLLMLITASHAASSSRDTG